ncbi:MAG: TRAP transporter large permease [Firmicutes bacterium]|nr:TRAP transporter large permease [Dethiobacter sp.]MBS3888063.1 TRAP transporter large permease [Bacillota bacterium]MBS4055221.1 TRAP transporter large permease [Thermaerobacter sp.]MBS4055518.1 TRAP transporter large permease [Thermaerobacter sp.]
MALVFFIFLLFMMMGMPVAFAIGIAGVVFFVQLQTLPMTIPVQLFLTQSQNFVLLAIPLFVFAGNLLNETGITTRLLRLSSILVGHYRAGLAQVTVVLSAMMGGISGSAIADASMQGRILRDGMLERGYSKGFSAGIIGTSSLIVTMIPPSIGLVLYGSIGEVSIGRLFAAGIVPGLLITTALFVGVSLVARAKGYLPEREARASFKEMATTFVECIWAFLFPIILMAGLRLGFFTPSEAGAFAVAYAIAIGVLAYREFTWAKFMKTLEATAIDIGMIMLVINMSAIFSYGITWENIPQTLATFLLGVSQTPWVIMLIIIMFLLVAGMFMDSTVLILLLTSILAPVAGTLGIDLVHFGIVMVLTLTVGLLTPPLGVVMFVVCSIFECSVGEFVRESWFFMALVVLVVVLIIFIPQLVLFLPNLMFGH